MFPLSDNKPSGKFPLITYTLIAFTSFVFLIQYFSPANERIILSYALIPSQVNFSNLSTLWPFLTSIFLHGGFIHIISNMWFLAIFGDNIEAYFGHLKFLIFYLIAGTAAAFVQYLFIINDDIPMLGASGAVAGILGAYYKLFPHHRIKTLIPIFGLPAILSVPAGFMLFYWFFIQLFSGVASIVYSPVIGGIAFWAHIGGFVFGMVMARSLVKAWRI